MSNKIKKINFNHSFIFFLVINIFCILLLKYSNLNISSMLCLFLVLIYIMLVITYLMLNQQEKHEIITYVNDNIEGESTVNETDEDMIVFAFEYDEENQALIGTEHILDLLKIGFFVIYSGLNDEGKFEVAISDANMFRY